MLADVDDTGTPPVRSLYAVDVRNCEGLPTELDDAGPCSVCGESRFERRYTLESTPFELIVCKGCGTGQLFPLPTSDQLQAFYPADYYGQAGEKFESWTEWFVRLVGGRHMRFIASRAPRGGRVLDVGCGRGVVASPLAQAGYEVHGFEISADAIHNIDPAVQVRIADSLSAADYPADFFDLVIVWHVLEHVPDPRSVLEEIQRVLKPGGRVVVAVPNFSSWQARWAGPAWFHLDPPRHLFHFPLAGLENLLSQCGFSIEERHHFSLRQNPFGWLQSWMNRRPGARRNLLYDFLQRDVQTQLSLTRWQARQLQLTYLFGMLCALPVSVLAALCRSGASVHVVGRKSPS